MPKRGLPVQADAVPDVVIAPHPVHVVVVLPDRCPADDETVLSELARHAPGRYVSHSIYPLNRAGRRLHARRPTDVWSVLHRPDGVIVAAGGPRRVLDVSALAHAAGARARQRWQAWKTLIAAGTPRAREWESFHPSPRQPRPSRLLSQYEARARFEAQPRVLAMLAVNGQRLLPFPLDPRELADFQAGERVYCTLAAQQAVVGQLLVLPGGFAYRPVTPSIADRLRYQHAALDVVHGLDPDRHVAALVHAPAR